MIAGAGQYVMRAAFRSHPQRPPSRLGLVSTILALMLACMLPAISSAAADPALDEALEHWEANDLPRTIIAIKRVFQLEPTDPRAFLLLARIRIYLLQPYKALNALLAAEGFGADEHDLAIERAKALLIARQFRRLLKEPQPAHPPPSKAAELQALLGEANLGLTRLDDAARLFESARKTDPRNTRAILGLALIDLSTGDVQAARQRIEDAIALKPSAAELWNGLARLEERDARLERAEKAYDQSLSLEPRDWQALYQRARVRARLGKIAEASADIDAAEAINPAFPGLSIERARILLSQSRPEAAMQLLERVLDRFPAQDEARLLAARALSALGHYADAESQVTIVLEEHPDLLAAARLLASIRIARGNYAGSEEALAPFAGEHEDDEQLQALRREILLGQGRNQEAGKTLPAGGRETAKSEADMLAPAIAMLKTDNAQRAIDELQAIVKRAPDSTKARHLLAQALNLHGQTEAALEIVQRLVQDHPYDANHDNLEGAILLEAGDVDKAREAFRRALAKAPHFTQAQLNLARLELDAGRPQQAADVLDLVLQQHPRNIPAILARARSDFALQDSARAEQRLRDAIAENPDKLALIVGAARLLIENGKIDQADAIIENTRRDLQAHPDYLLMRAKIAESRRHWERATASYEQLAKVAPRSTVAHLGLARAGAAMARPQAAIDALMQALKLDPSGTATNRTIEAIVSHHTHGEQRVPFIRQLLEVAPTQPILLSMLAQHSDAPAEVEVAIARLERLLTASPNDEITLRSLIAALAATERYEEAIEHAQAWLRKHQSSADLAVILGNLYLRIGKRDEATTWLKSAVNKRPRDASAFNNLAVLLTEEDPRTALVYAEHANALRPEDLDILDTLAQLLLKLQEYRQASTLLGQAYQRHPNNASLGFLYARALAGLGKTSSARSILTKIADKDFPENDEARKLLAEFNR